MNGTRPLSPAARQRLAERARQLESRTGIEAVVAVIDRCDAYPEIPWKAFSLFAALSLPASLGWTHDAVLAGLTFLASGALAVLLTLLFPAFARCFVNRERRIHETREYAAAFFFRHELARTHSRNALLMLLGRFERCVVLLPDAGLPLQRAELDALIDRMRPILARGDAARALFEGLDDLEALLLEKGLASGGGNALEPELIVEKGA